MNYSIDHIEEKGLTPVLLKDEKTGTQVSIVPEFGALLHDFTVKHDNDSFNVIDNYISLAQMTSELSKSFKSAKLSPFPCRIPGGKYLFEGREYEFQNKFIDGSAIHGLLYNKPFIVTEELVNEGMVSVSLLYNYKQDDQAFPFNYKCEVVYSLCAGSYLKVQTIITNEGEGSMPIADGWHPYFQLGGRVNEWYLSFDSEGMLEFNDRLIPTGRLLPYHHFSSSQKIGSAELDNCFILVNEDRKKRACELFNPQNKLKISFFPDFSYPYLQIFTPSHRRSIAIENLSAAPDCFNNKMGLILLQPGHSQSFTAGYQVSWM